MEIKLNIKKIQISLEKYVSMGKPYFSMKKVFQHKQIFLRNSPGQRPEACLILCLNCFKSISLIIVRSQGPRWAKLGVSDNPRIPVGEENRSKIVWWRFWGAPRGVFGRFSCRPSCAHVSGSLRGPFWEPFWPQKCSFGDLVFWSRGSFF